MNTNLPFDKGMVVRTVILFLAWLNQYLQLNGYNTLPFNDAQVEMGVSALVTFFASMWSWWKNNNVRYKARRNDQYLKEKGLK
ncbi:phage holin [Paenisporosarcina sp. OV554]|uniref:phage holin n=1 Tax=Paenisporosarcina sp. OV554 TaxID=2135694 RepID=UPI000D3A6A83|nr:phage holin [Paenisporosarcina sp. OV554]PUB12635.1 SPP1 family holin [Paenisporosarcina sp. OV554]